MVSHIQKQTSYTNKHDPCVHATLAKTIHATHRTAGTHCQTTASRRTFKGLTHSITHRHQTHTITQPLQYQALNQALSVCRAAKRWKTPRIPCSYSPRQSNTVPPSIPAAQTNPNSFSPIQSRTHCSHAIPSKPVITCTLPPHPKTDRLPTPQIMSSRRHDHMPSSTLPLPLPHLLRHRYRKETRTTLHTHDS